MWVSLTGTKKEDMQQDSKSLPQSTAFSWKVGYVWGSGGQLNRTVKADIPERSVRCCLYQVTWRRRAWLLDSHLGSGTGS